AIFLSKLASDNTPPGSYELKISPAGITLASSTNEGLFYGLNSLLQLIRSAENDKGSITLAGWHINDFPKHGWRGLMLDESRHFFGKETVKFLLDWMAFYKLNRFHWHLTDDPGWRVEIKKYPMLTQIGGIGD